MASTCNDDTSRLNCTFYIVITLCIIQVLTFVALLIFWKSFHDLKKNVLKYKDSLPMVNISPPSTQNIRPPAYPETPSIALGNMQKPEFNEVIEVMPTPDPERRRFPSSTVAIEKSPQKQSQERSQTLPVMTSFSALSRDSGIGSNTGRNLSTSSGSKDVARWSRDLSIVSQERVSVHEDSRTGSNASAASRDSKKAALRSRDLSLVSQERVSVHEESRTGSNSSGTSRDSKKAALRNYGLQQRPVPRDDDDKQHLHRLETMAIEMIDVQPRPNEKRYKRASQILNERNSMSEIEDNASFVNRGYSDASYSSQRSVPLASEECSLTASDQQNVFEDNNNGEEEKYENQEIVDQHRVSTTVI